jgi:regulator of protease activity HflC (stomatin/prohibitin superfamily)
METRELKKRSFNGWGALSALIAAALALGYAWNRTRASVQAEEIVILGLATLFWGVLCCGFFTLQPNIAAVLTLFGAYKGTVHESGFHWANPLYIKKKLSVRIHNLNAEKIKVNDLRGNPIEIAAIVVWRVTDTAKAIFDVEAFENFVAVQCEAALRHLAMSYPYDTFEGDTISLRGSVDEVSATLQREVQARVSRAGVHIEETRISHLAYAPEIASAMLQRQQAEAIVAARSRIVEGAVGMVEMALDRLQQHKTVELDEERKATMVNNLLVVCCGHQTASPVINTGTLYA